MSRSYSIVADNVTVAGATSLVGIRPAAAQALEIAEVRVAFSSNATSAQSRIQLVRQVVSGSPAFTSGTINELDEGNTQSSSVSGGTALAAGTAGINASTESSGARSVLVGDAFNHLTGWVWVPGPDSRIILAGGGDAFCVYFPAAPGTLTGWTCTVVYHEL